MEKEVRNPKARPEEMKSIRVSSTLVTLPSFQVFVTQYNLDYNHSDGKG